MCFATVYLWAWKTSLDNKVITIQKWTFKMTSKLLLGRTYKISPHWKFRTFLMSIKSLKSFSVLLNVIIKNLLKSLTISSVLIKSDEKCSARHLDQQFAQITTLSSQEYYMKIIFLQHENVEKGRKLCFRIIVWSIKNAILLS